MATWDHVACFDGERWTVYDRQRLAVGPLVYFSSISCDNRGNVWVGTNAGLLQFDGAGWTIYTPLNSGLPDWSVSGVACQAGGPLAGPTLWIGMHHKGLVHFSKGKWRNYHSGNSEMPGDQVVSLHLRPKGELWMGVFNHGVVRLWGREQFTTYDWRNSPFPSHVAWDIASDAHGNLWMATADGLVRFDDREWQVFTIYNSDIPDHAAKNLEIDQEGNLWVGTIWSGLMKYDGQHWTVYDTTNSPLPSNNIVSLAVDRWGNKWIGTWGKGLAIFREGGVILRAEAQESSAPQECALRQSYPNPFSVVGHGRGGRRISTTISFELGRPSAVKIEILDTMGRLIRVLAARHYPEGVHAVPWDGRSEEGAPVPSGLYFCRMLCDGGVFLQKMTVMR
jgi:hypothetical protein